MFNIINLSTTEIDDVKQALAEITGQLSGFEYRANSIGLISCTPDFITSGVVAALQDALPFALVGQTTIGTAVAGSDTLEALTILVLSSNDVEFVTMITDPIVDEKGDQIKVAYQEATAPHSDRPALILSYVPLLLNVGGDFFVNTLNKASGGVPIFGSLAVDNTIDYHDSRVIFNGQAHPNSLALVLFYGNYKPRFALATISQDKILGGRGIVTKSVGNQVMEIDGSTALEFLLSRGLATDDNGEIAGINSFPYIVDYNDGTEPVIRVIYTTTPEGHAVCLGDIPEGSSLSVGYFDDVEILRSTANRLDELPTSSDINGFLLFSCVGRFFTLGFDPDGEIREVSERLESTGIPYTFTYSGGEVCPVGTLTASEDTNEYTNRFHNATFVALVF